MKEKNLKYKILKVIYVPLFKVLCRPKVYGKENIPEEGPVIFVGNHIHAVDPVGVMFNTKRIVHFMAKESIFNGLSGLLFRNMGLIKVYRNKSNPRAVVEAVKILRNGGIVGIFPEGTRNRTEQELLPFRHGAVAIAKKANSKLVPFAIRGKYRIFRKGLEIEFGEPVDVSAMEVDEANEYIKNEVLKLLRK